MKTNTQEKIEEIKNVFVAAGYSVRRFDTGEFLKNFSEAEFSDDQWDKECFSRDEAYAVKRTLETRYAVSGITFYVNPN